MAELYRYAAFISYSSKDAAFAKRLHRALESYRIPSALGRFDLAGKPNRIYPVFRDREELAAGELGPGLEAALKASGALIVVCSPNAAASPWVAKEIATFARLGRRERIFTIIAPDAPLVTDGRDATPLAFPAIFLGEPDGDVAPMEPLAADARKGKDGFRNAFLKVVAGLIGVKAGDLQNRDAIRRRRRWLAGSAAAGLVLAIAAFAAWAWLIPSESYARSYVRRFGAWEEVDPIGAATAAKRDTNYRFTRRGAWGPVETVDYVNGQGFCPMDGMGGFTGDPVKFECSEARACGVRFAYDGERLIREELLDQSGQPLETIAYDGEASAIRTEAVRGCSRVDNGITLVEIERAASGPQRGYDTRAHFRGADRKARANASYAYGYTYTYDDAGRLTERASLGEDGAPAVNKNGWAIERQVRAQSGEIVEWQYLDAAGQPAEASSGFARQVVTRDELGRSIEIANFGIDGIPVRDSSGVHLSRYVRGPSGEILEGSFFDDTGAPTIASVGYAGWAVRYDEHGWSVGYTYLDAAGHPAPRKDGCGPVVVLVRTEAGLSGGQSCFDIDGKPMLNSDLWHRKRNQLNARGDKIEEAYFGIDGQPTLLKDGYHRVAMTWNDLGQRVGARFYGVKDEPVLQGENKIAGFDRAFDVNGFLVRESYVGLDGRPAMTPIGAARVYDVDGYGNETRETAVDLDGTPVFDKYGIVSSRYEYDDFGRRIRRSHFDAEGRAVVSNRGVAAYEYEFDLRGNQSEIRAYAADGSLVTEDGSISRYVYDLNGYVAREDHFDAAGKPMLDSSGAASTEFDRTSAGDLTEIRYFGLDGRPAANAEGVAIERAALDAHGAALEWRYLDTAGNPALSGSSGTAGWTATYDARGNRTEFVNRDQAWAPSAQKTNPGFTTVRYVFDARDREIERRFFDAEGKPGRTRQDEVYGYQSRYDANDRLQEETRLGPDGKPAPDNEGLVSVRFVYNALGRWSEVTYHDADGNLVTGTRSRVTYAYDYAGNETERRFYGIDGKLRVAPQSGRAVVRQTWHAGRPLEETSFGVEDQPVNRLDFGWFRKAYLYAPGGSKLGERCFTVDGTEVACEKPPPG